MDTLALVAIGSVIGAERASAWGWEPLARPSAKAWRCPEAFLPLPSNRTRPIPIVKFMFVGMAMVESTAIYSFVLAMILLFANPFWNYFLDKAGG